MRKKKEKRNRRNEKEVKKKKNKGKTQLLEACVSFLNSSASLRPFFIGFLSKKRSYFIFSKTHFNDRFHYFSFTNYSQTHSNIIFN